MDLSFLKNVEVKEVAVKAKAERVKVEKSPVEGASFRVYKNGRMFVSAEIADKFNLEFGAKEEITIPGKDGAEDKVKEVVVGNGLDIFSSENWQMIATPQPMLFVAAIPREGNAKIDVFGSCKYEDDGTPKGSIESNVPSTFVKEVLIPELESLYGVNFEEVDFVDLVMNTEYGIDAPRGIFSIPKTVSRGANKGELVFVTRKNITVFPLTVFDVIPPPPGIEVEETTTTQDPNQVDLEASIAEVTTDSGEEEVIEEPSISNNFKIVKGSKASKA